MNSYFNLPGGTQETNECLSSTAHYEETGIPNYDGNPLIEALPPIRSREETAKELAIEMNYKEEHRLLPKEKREHLIAQIPGFFQPLSQHLELDSRLGRIIRIGYMTRNPLSPRFYTNVRKGATWGVKDGNTFLRAPWVSATGMNLFGLSGVGKTTGLEASLSLYPQIIHHGSYKGQPLPTTQIPWLMLECPSDGTPRSLCIKFFQAIDELTGRTRYADHYLTRRANTDMLIPAMKHVAALQHLGVLVVDELQNLSVMRSGGEKKLMNLLFQLMNGIGLPVVFLGTYGVFRVLGREFRQARRGQGQGDFIWEPMKYDAEFRFFCETMWRYQYTTKATSLSDDLLRLLYKESQGITDIVIKLYALAQHRVIQRGDDYIEPSHIESVAADSLRLTRPVIKALREGNLGTLYNLDDVKLPDLYDLIDLQSNKDEARTKHENTEETPTVSTSDLTDEEGGSPTDALTQEPENPSRASTEKDSLMNIAQTGKEQRRTAYASLKDSSVIYDISDQILREASLTG